MPTICLFCRGSSGLVNSSSSTISAALFGKEIWLKFRFNLTSIILRADKRAHLSHILAFNYLLFNYESEMTQRCLKLTWSTGSSVAVFSSSCTSSAPRTSSLLFCAELLNTLGWPVMGRYQKFFTTKKWRYSLRLIGFHEILTRSIAERWSRLHSILPDLDRPGKKRRGLICSLSPAPLLGSLWGCSFISCWLHPPTVWLKFMGHIEYVT